MLGEGWWANEERVGESSPPSARAAASSWSNTSAIFPRSTAEKWAATEENLKLQEMGVVYTYGYTS